MKVNIRNEFTNKSITVDASKRLTVKKVKSWRNKLVAPCCLSGDNIGGRGPQENPLAYARLLARANWVIRNRIDE